MKLLNIPAWVVTSLLLASTASADVQLSIQNGRVSLKAKDATLRQIMQEWARVGQTKVVNVERIPGGPISLELTNVSEAEALDVLLRTVSGYIAALRLTAAADNMSRFDRIVVMPTAVAPRAALSSAPVPPVFQPPPPPVVDDASDDAPAGARPPIFGSFPQPQVINPAQQPGALQNPSAMPPGFQPPPGFVPPQQGFGAVGQAQPQPPNMPTTNTFGAPAGVPVPGMMVPVPQQPGQPGTPTQPGRGRGGKNP